MAALTRMAASTPFFWPIYIWPFLCLLLSQILGASGAEDGGSFGDWDTDKYGGAIYTYTMDQTTDPRALSNDTDPYFRLPTEQNFVVGNYRVTAHASNYGYLQARVDDASPAWLGEASGVAPASSQQGVRQYGLGWGFLLDDTSNTTALSTWYTGGKGEGGGGSPDTFERTFGLGYATKRVSNQGLSVEQTVVAPFGDDAALLSIITITNQRTEPAQLHWVENAGGAVRLQDSLSGHAGHAAMPAFTDGRVFANTHYTSSFSPLGGGINGMRQSRTWVPLNASEQAAYAALISSMPVGVFGGPPMPGPPEGASVWPTSLPASVFLDVSPPTPPTATEGGGVVVVAPAEFGTDCAAFYGVGGRSSPTMLHTPLHLPLAQPPVSNDDGCILASVALQLPPGASATIAFLWAYEEAPGGGGSSSGGGGARNVSALVEKYAPALAAGTLVQDTVTSWVDTAVKVTGVAPWVAREVQWHSYMLLSAASFDGTWGERMIDQGTAYRYVAGTQIAVRDPAQHLLGALSTTPTLSKSVLRYLLSMALPSSQASQHALGSTVPFLLPYGAANVHQLTNLDLRPSDQELYMMHAATEYFAATRDAAFFQEPILLYGDTTSETTVGEVLLRMLDYSLKNVSVGMHGLMRIQTSDWSDSFCTMFQPNCSSGASSQAWKDMFIQGESVLNAAMAAYVLPRFGDALDASGAGEGSPRFKAAAAAARAFGASQGAILKLGSGGPAWNTNGTWLRRAFLSNSTGFIGEREMFGTQHAWALLAGVIPTASIAPLVELLGSTLSSPSPFGMPVVSPPAKDNSPGGADAGTGENGGVWPALNHPLVMAFAGVNTTLAWQEWVRNSLHTSATVFPDLWASVWSSADNSNGPASGPGVAGKPGTWVATWPTQCAHRHAWPLVSLQTLAGISFDAQGLAVTPSNTPLGGREGSGGGGRVSSNPAAPAAEWGEAWSFKSPVVSIARLSESAWSGHWDPQPTSTAGQVVLGGGYYNPATIVAPPTLALRGSLPVAPLAKDCRVAVKCGGVERLQWHTGPPRAPTIEEARREGGAGEGGFNTFALVDVVLPGGSSNGSGGLKDCGVMDWELECTAAAATAAGGGRGGQHHHTRMRETPLPGDYTFGSGAFGQWQADEFSAPFYNYTLDQLTDPRASYTELSPSDSYARMPTDHIFQLGNDRIVALASNYGAIRVRTDEGGPKLLQDLYPPDNTYGGGFGYLVANNATLLLSSFFNGTGEANACASTTTRAFGLGYARVGVAGGCAGGPRAEVVHDVIIPPGNDAVVITVVNITNRGDTPTDFSWTEVYGARFYHLDLYSRQLQGTYNATHRVRGGGVALNSTLTSYLGDFRAFVEDHYVPAFTTTQGGHPTPFPGIQVSHTWKGLSQADIAEMARLDVELRRAAATNAFIGPMQSQAPREGGSLWDVSPPTAGLFDVSPSVAGDAGVIEMGSDCGEYFGVGGSRTPDGALRPLTSSSGGVGGVGLGEGAGCLAVRHHVSALPPGATATLAFVWAYATPRAPTPTPATLASKYAPLAQDGFSLRAATVGAALGDAFHFHAPGAPPWLGREVLWHSYQTHAALTFDDYFNETILDQGTDYRWGGGFQGAARDPLQHLLPLLYSRPQAARDIILYTLREMQDPNPSAPLVHGPPFFLLPYGIIQHGYVAPWGLRPSDLEVALLGAVGEYILATGDTGLLGEEVTTYNGVWKGTVGSLLGTAFTHRTVVEGVGEHGLLRVQGSDWSDSFCDKVPGCVFNNSVFQDMYQRGESLLNSALAVYYLGRYGKALEYAGPPWEAGAPAAYAFAEGQAEALRQWGPASEGRPWIRRSWLPTIGWQQDAVLEITQQAWHVLGGVFNTTFNAALSAAIRANLSDPSPIGPAIMGVPFPNDPGGAPGYGENGGVWSGSLNMPWVWALVHSINSTEAWEQFLLGTSANTGDVYGGEIWAGIWSASDVLNSFLHTHPGQPSWPRFPVLCTHRHAWPLWALTKLAGVTFEGGGVVLTPPPLPLSLRCGQQGQGQGRDVWWSLTTPRFTIAAYTNGSWGGVFSTAVGERGGGRTFHLQARLPIQGSCFGDGDGSSGPRTPLPTAWEGYLGSSRSTHATTAPVALEMPLAEEVGRWGTDGSSVLGVLKVDLEAPMGTQSIVWAVRPNLGGWK